MQWDFHHGLAVKLHLKPTHKKEPASLPEAFLSAPLRGDQTSPAADEKNAANVTISPLGDVYTGSQLKMSWLRSNG